jgi:two-component system LytT family response regulator/two-component system response regulator LytT
MSITALIIDDEQLAREELEYLLREEDDIDVLAQGRNGIEAVELIQSHRPDVVFLDVQMPGLDGFAVLKRLIDLQKGEMQRGREGAPLPQIVFATAFDQYAVRAFDVNAIDYLLKPFDHERVMQALDRVRKHVHESGPREIQAVTADEHSALEAPRTQDTETRDTGTRIEALLKLMEQQQAGVKAPSPNLRSGKIVLQAQSRLLLIDQRDICFAAIDEGTITVATTTIEGQSKCRTMEELLDLLDPAIFWRAHRSYVVNINHIREVVPWFKSSYQLRMADKKQTEIPVSRAQTRRLRELFKL